MSSKPPPHSGQNYVERFVTRSVVEAMEDARVVALLGPRQSGKSTLVRRIASSEMEAAYLTLDDATTLSLALDDPSGLISGYEQPLVIDEIQRAPGLLLAIKAKVDEDPERGQFLLTGSANLRQLPTVADSLPGRVDYLTLFPFSQGELRGKPETFLDGLFRGDSPSISSAPVGRAAYADVIIRGGYPEAQIRESRSLARFFAGYVQSIVDRDVPETARIHNPPASADLLRLVAARSASIARYESLGSDAGIDGKTAKSYVEVLERLYLVRVRRPWHRNLGKRQVKAPKLYVADTGLLAAMIGVDGERLLSDGNVAGSIFETFVAVELERQNAWAREPCTFWHLRDGNNEVDVIAERPNGDLVGIEVRAAATVRASDFRGLKWLRDQSGIAFKGGAILYTGDRSVPFGDRLWALPLQSLWQSQ